MTNKVGRPSVPDMSARKVQTFQLTDDEVAPLNGFADQYHIPKRDIIALIFNNEEFIPGIHELLQKAFIERLKGMNERGVRRMLTLVDTSQFSPDNLNKVNLVHIKKLKAEGKLLAMQTKMNDLGIEFESEDMLDSE